MHGWFFWCKLGTKMKILLQKTERNEARERDPFCLGTLLIVFSVCSEDVLGLPSIPVT